ncbi:coiled-coil domain-containing protein 191 isoform X1 [Rhopalosiphum maidis]|uniref:coiled-coil domain-containing protein 191 isoform X1 n=1 Tax=Rhopalosiphum maidis TaxID=43146 RepID=UPI000EFFB9BE|nr:coiled-coil domain-containing protein 191 isoform X1 [Rhopalosiphum maidis]
MYMYNIQLYCMHIILCSRTIYIEMTFNIDHRAVNFQYCNLAVQDVAQFSEKNLEDYTIVSRKQLDRIVSNSERHLTEDEHRWLIKRDCKRVISDINKCRARRKKSKYVERGISSIVDRHALQQHEEFRCENAAVINGVLNICRDTSSDARISTVVNNFTVINVQQLNVNIVNNNINYYKNDFNNRDGEQATISECSEDDCKVDRTTTLSGRRRDTSTSEKNGPEALAIRLLQRIYWNKWRNYAVKSKASRGLVGTNDKVDKFLSKIQEKLNNDDRRRKNRTTADNKQTCAWNRAAPTAKRTDSRDRQQAKIDEQKKLLEKQRMEIERLRLQQLKLESEKALLENQRLLQDLHHSGGSERRVKTRTVQPVQQSAAAASPSDILNRMEVRALERRAKWEAIKERRRKAELEEMRKKRELEEKCTRERMEQKRERLLEARENMRLRMIEEDRRKAQREVWRENTRIADDLYRKLLLRRGFEAFRANLNCARWRVEEASNHYDRLLVGTCFSKWRFYVNNSLNEKILLAEQFYKQKLIKTAFLGFYKILEERKKKQQVAEDWHNLKIEEYWFKRWRDYVREIRLQTQTKMLKAESYHNKIIMKRCFDNWRKFPEILYKERLKDCRLRMWHEKVQEILPDFIPPEFEL